MSKSKTKPEIEIMVIPIEEITSSFGAGIIPCYNITQETELIRMHLKVKELRAILEELLYYASKNKMNGNQGSMIPHDVFKLEYQNLNENDPTKNILRFLTTTMLAAHDGQSIKVSIKKQ